MLTTNNTRNELKTSLALSQAAQVNIEEIASLLNIWSKRPQATVDSRSADELRKLLSQAQDDLAQAAKMFDAVMTAGALVPAGR